MRIAVALPAAVLLLAVVAGPAAAQPRPPAAPPRPGFSPYLNLLGGLGNPGLNYFGLVRPQIQMQQQAAQLQQQIQQTNQALQTATATQGADPNLPFTGRGAVFGFYSHYYPTLGGGSGGAAAGGPRVGGFGGGQVTPAFARGQTGQAPQRATPSRGGGGIRR